MTYNNQVKLPSKQQQQTAMTTTKDYQEKKRERERHQLQYLIKDSLKRFVLLKGFLRDKVERVKVTAFSSNKLRSGWLVELSIDLNKLEHCLSLISKIDK